MSEPTATNPQTGEKIVFRNGQWQPLTAAAPSAPAMPQRVYGAPKQPDQPTAIEIERIDLARRAGERADRAEQRAVAKDQRGTVEQGKAASFLTRAINAEKNFSGLGDVQPRSLPGQAFKEAFPNAANYVSDANRQIADQAEREFIAAILRYDSGAAIPDQEFVTNGQIYFPRPGDTPEVLAKKAQARRVAIEGLYSAAGPAASGIEMPSTPDDSEDGLAGSVSFTPDPNNPAHAEYFDDPPPSGGGDPHFFGQFGEFMDAAGAIGKQGLSLGLSDEAAGIGGAISSVLRGEGVAEGYTRERDAERDRIAAARDRLGWGGTALEIVAGGGAGKVVNSLGSVASAARQGAGFGALGGFGYGEGAASAPNALIGAATGGAIGAGFQRGANALAARRAPAPTQDQAALVAAADRQGIPLRQPDVRPELRGNFAAAEQTPSAGPVIRAAVADDRAAVEAGVRSVTPGSARDEFALGTTTQGAARRTAADMKTKVDALYKRARERAGSTVVQPTRTIASINARIATLQRAGESANAAEVRVLEGIKDDLSKTGLTIDSLQAQRKTLRDRISQSGMDPDKAEAGFIDLMKEAANELAEGLPDQAKGALKTAEAAYIERRRFQDEIARQFLGTRNAPIPPERAATRFLSMVKGKGDYSRFSRMFGQLDDAEKSDFAATIAEGLGTKANGEFEYGKFLRDLEQVNPRALRDVFGADGVAALNDLKAIARAKAETIAARNHSGTGGTVERVGNRLQGVILTAFGANAGGLPGAVAGGVVSGMAERFSSQRAARMLLNPDFTKWLRQTPTSTSPQVINRHFERLNQIAARSGTLSLQSDARALQDHLSRAFSQSPMRAAAEGQQEKDRR